MSNWTFTELDERIAAELRLRLTAELFDAHAHVYRVADLPPLTRGVSVKGPADVTVAVWRAQVERQVGVGRLLGGLLFPFPVSPATVPRANDYLFRDLANAPDARGLALVAPESRPAAYEELLAHPQFAGFKPCHLHDAGRPAFESRISEMVPDWVWEFADRHGKLIMLHLVRDVVLADADNLRELRQFCNRNPNARLILTHADGLRAANTINGIAGLRGLDNVWFDTSGVCESPALQAMLHEFGPRRLLWGSDFPVSEIRGRCVTVGDGFAWLESDAVNWEKTRLQGHPTLVGLESLRALQGAVDVLGLNAADRQDIYADNARRLLGLMTETGTQTQDLYRRAKVRIPGGTQLLSKRPEMLAPDQWPAYFREARGCEVWDLDGRHYYDFSTNGIGACLLGFRDPDVSNAVRRRIEMGSMCTLNPPEEVELAELLCALHPWAEQARFARCGGEACAVAVRIARATTDRSLVAICGYHGWQDWYLAANLGENDALRGHLLPGLNPLGVPRDLRGTVLTFGLNDRSAFQLLLDQHGRRLAAVIMEPCRSQDPDPGFLEFVRDGAHRVGALLIIDEITMGWRLNGGGAHLKFGLSPDLAVFAKALGNGHPMAAVIGTCAAMAGANDSFISSTYWTEGVGPVAALATIRKMQTVDVPAHVARVGMRVQAFWEASARRHGLPVQVNGYPCLAHFVFQHPQANALRTWYTQLMLGRRFLAGASLYPTLAHTDAVVDRYGEAIEGVFQEMAGKLEGGGDITRHLCGPIAHSGFRRLAP